MQRIGVVGAGAWGTALANAAARAGRQVTLWAHEPDVATDINRHRLNSIFLPGIQLREEITATHDMADLAACEALLLVAPAQHMRAVTERLRQHVSPGIPALICSKGIEVATGKLMSVVIADTLPEAIPAILSGPTFAGEVARGLPCALTLAIADETLADQITASLGQPTFRLYSSTDVPGAQIGGAIKNVMAIASGMVAGLQLGENARAAVITRGLAEMMRFGQAFDARRETLMGLSGLGDLILTCSSLQSRNMSLGKALGEGRRFEDIMAERRSVAEGAHTVEVVETIARDHGISMPIAHSVFRILKDGAAVNEVVRDLLERPFTREIA